MANDPERAARIASNRERLQYMISRRIAREERESREEEMRARAVIIKKPPDFIYKEHIAAVAA